jgi:hypothetical protein
MQVKKQLKILETRNIRNTMNDYISKFGDRTNNPVEVTSKFVPNKFEYCNGMMLANMNRKKMSSRYYSTLWRRSLMIHVEELIKKEPTWIEVINEYHRKLLTGFFKQEYINSLGQKGYGTHDFYDAYAFCQIHTALTEGEIFLAKIEVTEPPYADNELEANNQILSLLPKPFKAKFSPDISGPDGKLWWRKNITVAAIIIGSEGAEKKIWKQLQPTLFPDGAPLEVGYTDIGKSFMQLSRNFGLLARWPYDSSEITLFYADKWGIRDSKWSKK